MRTQILRWSVTAVLVGVSVTGCAESDDDPSASAPIPVTTPGVSVTPSLSPSPTELPNACPAEGCRATIDTVTPADGGELTLTLSANFDPDVSRNHFHIYWDTYTAQQVSDDAEPRFNVTPGDWVPTDANPYTTGDATSVSKRGTSTKLCVTAGDRDHNVLDPAQQQCYDVSALL